jgi:tight adherence protein B
VLEAVDSLTLDKQTLLYPGVAEALDMVGTAGSRSVLVLSDGKDTTGQDLSPLLVDVKRSGVQLDVVSLGLDRQQLVLLGDLASAGRGEVLTATDPAALTELFTDQAAALQSQVLVNFRCLMALTAATTPWPSASRPRKDLLRLRAGFSTSRRV